MIHFESRAGDRRPGYPIQNVVCSDIENGDQLHHVVEVDAIDGLTPAAKDAYDHDEGKPAKQKDGS